MIRTTRRTNAEPAPIRLPRPTRWAVNGALAFWLFALGPAAAVLDWQGQPGGYVPVENGVAPNRRWAVVAHEDGSGRFGLFLQNRDTLRTSGEIAKVLEPLDTEPAAFHAEWAPDSRHVAIWHRVDTRLNQLVLYRVENEGAYPVSGNSLLRLVSPEFGLYENDVETGFQSLKWISAARFILHANGVLPLEKMPVKKYLRLIIQTGEYTRPEPNTPRTIRFSIDGECELTGDDRYRVLRIFPGRG